MTIPPDGAERTRGSRTPIDIVFLLIAIAFAAAALYHAAALVEPSIGEPSPAWRHALFVVVNGAVGLLFVRRPRWFAAVFALLALQQLYSHGTHGWAVWRDQHRVDWASVLVVLAVPLIALLLGHEAIGSSLRTNRDS